MRNKREKTMSTDSFMNIFITILIVFTTLVIIALSLVTSYATNKIRANSTESIISYTVTNKDELNVLVKEHESENLVIIYNGGE